MKVLCARDLESHIRIESARFADHCFGDVDADDFRAGLGDLIRQMAGAATEIEYSLTGLWREQLDHAAAVLPHECVLAVVQRGVPRLLRVFRFHRLFWYSQSRCDLFGGLAGRDNRIDLE